MACGSPDINDNGWLWTKYVLIIFTTRECIASCESHTHTSRGRMAKWNEDVIFRLYSIIILDKKRITKRRRFNDACWVLKEKAEIPSQQQRGAFATSFQGCCCCCRRGYLQHAMQTYCIIVQTDRVPLKDPYLLHSVNLLRCISWCGCFTRQETHFNYYAFPWILQMCCYCLRLRIFSSRNNCMGVMNSVPIVAIMFGS